MVKIIQEQGVLDLILAFFTSAALTTALVFRRRMKAAESNHTREKDRLKAELETLEQRLEARTAILELLPDPLLTLDERFTIIRANRAARELFDIDQVEKPLSRFIRAPEILDGVQQALSRNRRMETEYVNRDGNERFFRVLFEVIPPQTYSRTRLLVAFSETTALKQAARTNADFVANASHELRTPLTGLLGFIETLQGAAKNDAGAREHFLGIMHEQALRMTRLVQDMLQLQKIERNLHAAPSERVNLSALLDKIIESLAIKADQRQMRISFRDRLKTPDVLGDTEELTQIFQNLLDNAIKYGAAGSTIELELDSASLPPKNLPAAAVRVRNEGEGIDPEDVPRLTERFYRTKAAREKSDSGTGLGLAIVKNAVNRHQGKLEISSAMGGVTQFTVYLPIAPVAASRVQEASQA
jgi:two-component system phosphate regulon sensor histidine kinase PhoR